jgi:hypothetical protein
MDLVDFLSYAEFNDGYSYVLTMIDVFSRYVWAIPLLDKEGSTIHREVVNIFMNFGPPTKLQADNGSEFITSVLKRTCEVFQTKLVHGRARHPQSQGKVERFNQTLGRHLTKMMWDEASQVQGYRWIDILPSFIIAYNKVPHEAHKKSPYEAFFGFKMRCVYNTPINIPNDTPTDTTNDTLQNGTPPNDTSNNTLPDDTLPDDTLPDDTLPDDTLPDDTHPNSTHPNSTHQNDIQPTQVDFITQIDQTQNISDSEIAVYESHVTQVKRIREKIAQNDEVYRNKLVTRASIHRRKPAFEPGDKVSIAPDHDTNQKTRKRKFEQTCSMTGKVIGMCSNNRTVRVEVNGEVKTFPAKNLRKLRQE